MQAIEAITSGMAELEPLGPTVDNEDIASELATQSDSFQQPPSVCSTCDLPVADGIDNVSPAGMSDSKQNHASDCALFEGGQKLLMETIKPADSAGRLSAAATLQLENRELASAADCATFKHGSTLPQQAAGLAECKAQHLPAVVLTDSGSNRSTDCEVKHTRTVRRNQSCPCGSHKKYKACCRKQRLTNTEENLSKILSVDALRQPHQLTAIYV